MVSMKDRRSQGSAAAPFGVTGRWCWKTVRPLTSRDSGKPRGVEFGDHHPDFPFLIPHGS